MRKTGFAIAALIALAACSRGENYESGGDVDTADTTARFGLPDVDVGTRLDTLSVPTFGTQKDTIVVDKPVVTGRKPVEVKRPTVDVRSKADSL